MRDVCHARVFESKDKVNGDVWAIQAGRFSWVGGLGAAGNIDGFEVEVLLMLDHVLIRLGVDRTVR